MGGYADAEFCLDVTRGDTGGLRIVPVIRAGDGQTAVPVAFIGAEGHGAVCVDHVQAARGDPGSWRFGLARLTRPVPSSLQRMALGGGSLEVPAADEPRFRERYYPRLRQAADRGLLGRRVHAARDLRARAGAARRLRRAVTSWR